MSRIAFALLLIPSIAAAQAPGEDMPAPEAAEAIAPAPEAPTAAPAIAPLHGPFAAVVAVPPPKPVELSKRFGVAARMVSLGLSDGTTDSEYAGGGIAASYRINRRWELVLALDALDAPEGPDLHSTSIEARFHLTPYRRWDWYALAGIGALHEVPLEGAEDEGVSRGRVHAGLGLARRFRSWSVAAELHTVGVGPRDEMATSRKASTPMTTEDGLSGGELTVAATLFF
jgi:hypothetical protein